MNKASNREIAMSVFDLVETGEFRKWFDKHTNQDFIHHNQCFEGDRESLIQSIEEDVRSEPDDDE